MDQLRIYLVTSPVIYKYHEQYGQGAENIKRYEASTTLLRDR